MAKSYIGTFAARLSLETAEFGKRLKGATKDLQGFAKRVNEVGGRLATKGLVGLGVAAGATSAILAVGQKRALSYADAMGKMADRTGFTTETLSSLRVAAKLGDVSLEGMANAMRALQRRTAQAADGMGEARHSFELMNLDAKELKRLAPERQFAVVADAISKLENQSDRARAAMDIFGETGVKMLTIFKDGAGGLKEFQRIADRTGATVTNLQARLSERFNDTISKLGLAFEGTQNRIARALLPTMNAIADAIFNATVETDEFNKALDTVLDFVDPIVATIASIPTIFKKAANSIAQDIVQLALDTNKALGGLVSIPFGGDDALRAGFSGKIADMFGVLQKPFVGGALGLGARLFGGDFLKRQEQAFRGTEDEFLNKSAEKMAETELKQRELEDYLKKLKNHLEDTGENFSGQIEDAMLNVLEKLQGIRRSADEADRARQRLDRVSADAVTFDTSTRQEMSSLQLSSALEEGSAAGIRAAFQANNTPSLQEDKKQTMLLQRIVDGINDLARKAGFTVPVTNLGV